MKRKISCIGVGKMGKGVCHNLIIAGQEVSVFDINKEAMDIFKGEAYIASSAEEAFSRSDITFLSMPNSSVVEKLVDCFIELGVKNKSIVDISTSYPLSTRFLYRRLKELGGVLLDAPLLGGPKEAWAGTLTTVVAGDKEIIDSYCDIFSSYSKSYTYVGQSGNGHLIKLAQNWAGLLQAVLYAQLYPVMAKYGIDTATMFNILDNEFFANWFFKVYSQKYINREYKPAFALELGLKDLTYMKKLCDELNVPGFMLDGAIDLCRITLKEGRDRGIDVDMANVCETMFEYVGLGKDLPKGV
jgi:3-hydroxyisobutyrate dehydrogenase-like beta-hydroxyacid dehydrogenase